MIEPEPAVALSGPEAGPAARPGSGSPAPSVPEPRPPGAFAGVWEGSIKFSGGGTDGGIARLELADGDETALTGTFTLLQQAGLDLLAMELGPSQSLPSTDVRVSGSTLRFNVGRFPVELTVSADRRRLRGWLVNPVASHRPSDYLDLQRQTPPPGR
jgi:hypothetical protein